MAAKKVLFLLSKQSSPSSLKFAEQYFKAPHFDTTIILPDNIGQNHNPLINGFTGSSNTIPLNIELLPDVFKYRHADPTQNTIKNFAKYADLIVGDRITFSNWNINSTASLSCNKMILPDDSEQINKIVFIHDGTDDNLQVIKQFSMLMGKRFHDKEVYLFCSKQLASGTEQKMLVEYLKTHFKNVAVHRFTGEEPEKLQKYLQVDRDMLLITGSDYDEVFLSKYFNRACVATLSN